VFRRLAEADAGVQHHAVFCYTQVSRRLQPRIQEVGHLAHHVSVSGLKLHRGRRPLHVHQDDARPVGSHHLGQQRVAEQGGDVVDDVSAGVERLARDLRLGRVHGQRHGGPPGQFADHRHDALQFFFEGDGL